ncbi:MAG: XdhC family protein [Alphaproteobacteria bacterium]|nr:XdhC family protein [Alphaproteobacteria bacterium]
MKLATLKALTAARAQGREIAVATRLADGEERLIDLTEPPCDDLEGLAVRMAARDDSAPVELMGETWFINVFNPPVALVVVGAVHIAQPLSRMAAALGWAVTVIDPRTAFASEARFPGVTLTHDWPDEAIAKVAPTTRTAVVTLTHDPKLDDPALQAALKSRAFFIGSLGSKKTHAARLARLEAAGFNEETLSRIRGPVGLNINARSPAEIAVSIVGQIVETLRAGSK